MLALPKGTYKVLSTVTEHYSEEDMASIGDEIRKGPQDMGL